MGDGDGHAEMLRHEWIVLHLEKNEMGECYQGFEEGVKDGAGKRSAMLRTWPSFGRERDQFSHER